MHTSSPPKLERLDGAGLTYQVAAKFAEIDPSPEAVSNHEMGYAFEELIRRFSEISNETAGEHFTPREGIRLMVNLLLAPGKGELTTPGVVKTMPARPEAIVALSDLVKLRGQHFVQRAESRPAVESLQEAVSKQLDLLADRRHALITAAVAGQLDVTTARSGVC